MSALSTGHHLASGHWADPVLGIDPRRVIPYNKVVNALLEGGHDRYMRSERDRATDDEGLVAIVSISTG